MNTILITCSKDKASVNDDDGRFLNRVSNGVLVEKGDQISVEQIAINSIGVGSDIVEIPRELDGYNYYTNELNLKSAFYIHHNYEFTLQLPCILATQGLALQTAFNFIRPFEPPGGTGILPPQPFYGYMMGDNGVGGGAPDNNFQLLKTTIPKIDAVKTAGKRFWFIKATHNGIDPNPPNVSVDVFSIPTLSVYEFIDTNVPLSVDVGYDSPSNIAGKLTEDLHSTLLHPLQTPLDTNIEALDAPYELPNNNYSTKELQSVSSSDGCIAVLGSNFTRSNPKFPPGNGQSPGTPMYECIAALNPFLWIWGSRLLQGYGTKNFAPTNPPTPLGGMGWKNNYLIREAPGALIPLVPAGGWEEDTYSIYNLYNLPRRTDAAVPPVIYNSFVEGYVLVTNLCWTTPNVRFLAELIHSQMNYTGSGTTTANMTSSTQRESWIYNLPFGRCRDDASYLTPDITPALKPLLQAGATTPLGGYGTGFENNSPELPVQGFFNNALYQKAYLGADDLADGCTFPNPENIAPIYNKEFDLNNPLDPVTAAKYYDVNLIPVANLKTGVNAAFNEEVYIGVIINDYKNSAVAPVPNITLIEKANYCIVDLAAKNRKNPFVALVNPNLKAAEATGVVPAFTPTSTTIIPAIPAIPAYTETIPQPDLVTPQPDLVTPQPDLVTPQPDLVTPQPDIYTPPVPEVPAVPATSVNMNSTADGNNALVSDFDVGNNVSPLALGNGSRLFTDDGGLNSDYSTSHSRHITYDAGAGNKILINVRDFEYEHSTYSMYDRMGITCGDNVSALSLSSGNLSSADSTLSQHLYQSSNSSPSSFWGSSWVASNGGYGSGGGWIFPNTAGTDVKGNDNSGWINTWYEIDARYVRFWFKSDGSATEPGWDILVARQVNTPAVPAIPEVPGFYTPQPDLVTPQPDLVTPQPDLVTPQPDLVTPQPDVVINHPEVPEVPEQTITNLGANPTADYVNTTQIGTPNPSLQFDPARGRFNFQNLHWDRFEGNKRGSSADPANTEENPSADVIVNSLNKEIEFFDSLVALQKAETITLVAANSGIGLIDVGLATKNAGVYEYLTDIKPTEKGQFWSESLLSRLGFDYKALFNPYGLPDSWYLTRTYETFTNSKLVQYFPYPLTTNSVLDSTLAFAYDQTNTPTPYPMYNLSSQQGRWNVNASTSTSQIFATSLPQKLVFPFWLIYSDIIGGITFHSSKNGAESNIIAICNRSYVSGDFSYSFATDYVFTATKDFVITGITTQILNPDLTPANIDERTTIVYKVTKPLKMFQEAPPSNKEQEKANLKQRTGR